VTDDYVVTHPLEVSLASLKHLRLERCLLGWTSEALIAKVPEPGLKRLVAKPLPRFLRLVDGQDDSSIVGSIARAVSRAWPRP